MAKAQSTPPAAPSKIRFLTVCVCAGSVWARHEVMDVNEDNRAEAEAAVARGSAEWVNDDNATGNTANA